MSKLDKWRVQKMQIKNVDGMSGVGRVSMLSDEFVATASMKVDGTLDCKVERRPSMSRWLSRHEWLPIPRLLMFALFLADSMPKQRRRILVLAVIAVEFIFHVLRIDPAQSIPTVSFFKQYWWALLSTSLIGWFTYMRMRIAAWHGAEHMTIAAYERTSNVTVQTIREQSPINDRCGGRLILPGLMGLVAVTLLLPGFGREWILAIIATFETGLWVEFLVGFRNIPGTSHASHLLQKWITTCTPGEREILTAQRAMQALLDAHHAN